MKDVRLLKRGPIGDAMAFSTPPPADLPIDPSIDTSARMAIPA